MSEQHIPVPPDETDNSDTEELHLSEPPIKDEDTRPKTATSPLQPLAIPRSTLDDTAEFEIVGPSRARTVLLLFVMGSMVCLCLLMASMAGMAGYRDALATNDVKNTSEVVTQIAEQYFLGSTELATGDAMAVQRFEWIVEVTKAPTQYALDSATKLALARTMEAARPTRTPPPSLTPTGSTPTPEPTPTPTVEPSTSPIAAATPASTPTPGGPDLEAMYEQAQAALRLTQYEEAIEWLEAIQSLDPAFRAAEVQAALIHAYTEQGEIYLRGQNKDGQDMLQRGVQLIYKANAIQPVEPPELLGEATFVENYINARSYVNGGQYAAALPILEDLCNWNCGWSYRGVSVQMLLEQARAGAAP